MKVVTTDAAKGDIREILSVYNAPSRAADEFNLDMFEAVDHLTRWPYTGHRRRDLTKRDVCFWYFAPFYIVLHVEPNLLTIVAVLRSRRDVANILRKRLKRPA